MLLPAVPSASASGLQGDCYFPNKQDFICRFLVLLGGIIFVLEAPVQCHIVSRPWSFTSQLSWLLFDYDNSDVRCPCCWMDGQIGGQTTRKIPPCAPLLARPYCSWRRRDPTQPSPFHHGQTLHLRRFPGRALEFESVISMTVHNPRENAPCNVNSAPASSRSVCAALRRPKRLTPVIAVHGS